MKFTQRRPPYEDQYRQFNITVLVETPETHPAMSTPPQKKTVRLQSNENI